jgi:hypothetical protein
MLCLRVVSHKLTISSWTSTYAMMLTCFPFAFFAMLSASFADLASMLPLGNDLDALMRQRIRNTTPVL